MRRLYLGTKWNNLINASLNLGLDNLVVSAVQYEVDEGYFQAWIPGLLDCTRF